MKLFMDMDETLIKSGSKATSHVTNKPSFFIFDKTPVFVRPDISELNGIQFSVFSAGSAPYVGAIVEKLKHHYDLKITSWHSRGEMAVIPDSKKPVYEDKCLLIDERAATDWVVIQKLNVLPNGSHLQIRPFNIIGTKIGIFKRPGMGLKECLLLGGFK